MEIAPPVPLGAGAPRVRSPLSLASLGDLYLAPSRFFAQPARLAKRPELLLVAWAAGIAYAMDRVESRLVAAELGANARRAEQIWASIGASWPLYWAVILGVGLLNGLILYWLAGWWYRKRLQWSGARRAAPADARATYVYQDLVQTAPALLVALAHTLLFPHFRAAWESEELWSTLVVVFVFWSCATSFRGVCAGFPVVRWKARLWFLILPAGLYATVMGGVAVAFALLEPGAA